MYGTGFFFFSVSANRFYFAEKLCVNNREVKKKKIKFTAKNK